MKPLTTAQRAMLERAATGRFVRNDDLLAAVRAVNQYDALVAALAGTLEYAEKATIAAGIGNAEVSGRLKHHPTLVNARQVLAGADPRYAEVSP